MMKSVAESAVTSLRTLNRAVNADLATICLKCLEKRPGDRYPSAAAVAEDLERWLNHEPILARPVTPVERTIKWMRREPALAGLCFTAVVLVLVLSIGGPLVAIRETGLRKSADDSRIATDKARALAEIHSEEVAANRYTAEMLLAAHELDLANGVVRARSLTAKWRPEPGAKDRRGWEWHYLNRQVGQELFQLEGHRDGIHSVDWSSDERWIATGGLEGQLRIFSVTNAAPRHEFKSSSQICVVRFNRTGTLLAAGEDSGAVSVRDTATAKHQWKVRAPGGVIFPLDWNPAGDQVVQRCPMKGVQSDA